MELDLGRTEKGPMDMVASPAHKEPKITYPSFSIQDDAAKAFVKQFGDCEVGDEYTMTVKTRIKARRDDEYGSSIELQVLSVVGDKVEEAEGEEDQAPPAKGRSVKERAKLASAYPAGKE